MYVKLFIALVVSYIIFLLFDKVFAKVEFITKIPKIIKFTTIFITVFGLAFFSDSMYPKSYNKVIIGGINVECEVGLPPF